MFISSNICKGFTKKGGKRLNKMFEQKYKEYEKALFLIAIGYLHNTEDARDCVQDAVFSAFRSYDKLKNKEYFKTWITRIVINKCRDHLRKRKYHSELKDNLDVFYEMPQSELEIIDAICRLDTNLAQYITLRFYNNMTYEETAKALKQPVSTVKYRTKKALLRLKDYLEGDADR